MTNAIATATFKDIWFGDLAAYLIPSKTTRKGQRVTVYRWMTERNTVCDGLAHGMTSIERMVTRAQRHALFSNVTVAA
jgi:hypothetical protein